MAMRDLVTGGAACAVDGPASSSANPLGKLANALVGSSSKQEKLNGIPTTSSTSTGSASSGGGGAVYQDTPADYMRALELDYRPNSQGSEFLRGFRSSDHSRLADAWDEVQLPAAPMPALPHLDHVYDRGQLHPTLDGPPQRVLSNVLHSFVGSTYGGVPFLPTLLPQLGLSEGDKQCIRDRSSIMARHFFADKSEDFISQQVNALLSSLDIDSDIRAKGPLPGRFRELEDYWNESQGALPSRPHGADGWIQEFSQQRGNPDAWVHSFEQQHGANGWASEFEQEQRLATADRVGSSGVSHLAAMEQTRMLAHTLAQNSDPKFQNSKFLQFVSKMSRGELIIDENQVKPAASSSGDWATEYQQQYTRGHSWADEFADKVSQGPDHWANEFAGGREQIGSGDQWADEFSKLQINDWVEEFGQQVGEGAFADNSDNNWAKDYDEYLNEQVTLKPKSDASRGIYVFSDMNPYVGHPNLLRKARSYSAEDF